MVATTLNIYNELIKKHQEEEAAFRSQYPILVDLWNEVEIASAAYDEARDKYDTTKKLIEEAK